MIDTVGNLIQQVVDLILGLVRDHGPLVLFLAGLIETAAWFFPSEALLAAGGYMVQQGHLRAEVAWVSVFAGVLLSDHLAYVVGRVGGRRLIRRLPCQGAFQQVEKLVLKYGGPVVLFGRFSGPIRSTLLFTVGSMGLPYRGFWPFELLGAAIWAGWWLAIGAAGGALLEQVPQLNVWRQWLFVASCVLLAVLAWRYREDLRRFLRGEAESA